MGLHVPTSRTDSPQVISKSRRSGATSTNERIMPRAAELVRDCRQLSEHDFRTENPKRFVRIALDRTSAAETAWEGSASNQHLMGPK